MQIALLSFGHNEHLWTDVHMLIITLHFMILTHKCVIFGLDTITVNSKKSFPIIYTLKQFFYSKSAWSLNSSRSLTWSAIIFHSKPCEIVKLDT